MLHTDHLTGLTVGEIENLFWTNGSREVPNKLPTTDLFDKTVLVKINWSSKVSGTVLLNGIWNYALYKGSYYFLDIVTPRDNNEQRFLYTIYRDEWAEFITTNKTVTGTLIKTNIDKVLWENLQTTAATISNLGESKIISLLAKSELDSNLGVQNTKPLPIWDDKNTWVVTSEKFKHWYDAIGTSGGVGNPGEANVKKGEKHSQQGLLIGTPDHIALKCLLEMSKVPHWSHSIYKYLKAWMSENKTSLNVCLVNNAEAMGIQGWINQHKEENDVENVYCVEPGWGVGLLSNTVEENNYIETLDLSTLTDIQVISKQAYGTQVSTKNVLAFFSHKNTNEDTASNFGLDDGAGYQIQMRFDLFGMESEGGQNWSLFREYYMFSLAWMNLRSDASTILEEQSIIFPTTSIFDTKTRESFPLELKGTGRHDVIDIVINGEVKADLEDNIYQPTTTTARNRGIRASAGDLVFQDNDQPNDDTQEYKVIKGCAFVDVINFKTNRPTDFIKGRRNLAFVETTSTCVMGDDTYVKGAIPTPTTTPLTVGYLYHNKTPDAFVVACIRHWTLSPFLLNQGSGTIKSKGFKDLPAWAKIEQTRFAQWMSGSFTQGPWKWELNTRQSVNTAFKNTTAHTCAHRPWVWPKDDKTGDYIYLIASHSADDYYVYLHTPDLLQQYRFTFAWPNYASNYSIPIKKIWGSLPRTKPPVSNTHKYVTWTETNPQQDGPWVYDVLGTSKKNQATYLGDHGDDYSSNWTEGKHLDALERILVALYDRFSPELSPHWDDVKKGYYINWPVERDFQDTCMLFDLVGTSYIMCMQKKADTLKPKISLIVKNNDVIERASGGELLANQGDSIRDIVTAINQNNIIFLHGHTFEIKTKLTFHSSHDPSPDKWSLNLRSFDLSVEGLNEYYIYEFKGPHEYIQGQFNINKTSKATAADNINMGRLLLEREQYNEQRKIDLHNVDNNNRNSRTSLATAYEDYTLGKDAANTQWWSGIASSALTAPAAMFQGAMTGAAMGAAAGPGGAVAGAAIGGATSIINSVKDSVMNAQAMGMHNYQAGRDLAEREAQQGKQIELSKNQADHTHKYAEIRMRRELERMTAHRVSPDISERVILNGYLAELGRTKYHIIHSTPSPAIMPYLKAFYLEYGADVLVNNWKFSVDLVTTEDKTTVIQFASIHGSDIKDVILLRHLQGRLLSGIKIIHS